MSWAEAFRDRRWSSWVAGVGPVIVAGLLAGCPKAPPVQATWAGDPAGAQNPDPTAAPEPEPLPPTATAKAMHAQLATVATMRDAVIQGDRALAIAHAQRLREQASQLQTRAELQTSLDALEAEASSLGDDAPLPEVAMTVARLGAKCGACHTRGEVEVVLPDEPMPRVGAKVESVMKAHGWAAARMWEGLVGPSDERWRVGTSTLLAVPGCKALPAARQEAMKDVCDEVAKLIRSSHLSEDPSRRAELYGRLLPHCESCHATAPKD